jgi:hypothetical protein
MAAYEGLLGIENIPSICSHQGFLPMTLLIYIYRFLRRKFG